MTLDDGAPVTALDAATGESVREYGETTGATEFVIAEGRLCVVAGDATPAWDAITATAGRLYLATEDGRMLCLAKGK